MSAIACEGIVMTCWIDLKTNHQYFGRLLALILKCCTIFELSWFERAGFGHIWDTIISSTELGIRKLGPQIYQATLRQLGLHPAQAVLVGHKAIELAGAITGGMKTVAFNYDKAARADYYIPHFAELLELPFVDRTETGHS